MADSWAIRFEGFIFRESDLTLGDTVRALEITGGSWATLHPLAGPGDLIGLLTAFLVRLGEDPDDALLRVSRIPVLDAVAMVTVEEEGAADGVD